MEDHLNRVHELRDNPKVGAVMSIKSDGVAKAGLANMAFFEKIGQAVMKGKKFRAVLEYDPEELNSIFFIEFDEPGNIIDPLLTKEELEKVLHPVGDGKAAVLEIHPTKDSAEQASFDRIKNLGYGSSFYTQQRQLAKLVCERIKEKISQKANMGEINELIRSLSHFEKTGTLPDAEVINETANAYVNYVEKYMYSPFSKLSGDATLTIAECVRCIHRLNDIMWNMRNQTTFHSETSVGAS